MFEVALNSRPDLSRAAYSFTLYQTKKADHLGSSDSFLTSEGSSACCRMPLESSTHRTAELQSTNAGPAKLENTTSEFDNPWLSDSLL